MSCMLDGADEPDGDEGEGDEEHEDDGGGHPQRLPGQTPMKREMKRIMVPWIMEVWIPRITARTMETRAPGAT